MTVASMEKITVLGGGVLGSQIAWQSAFSGKTVVVYDLHDSGLEQCRVSQETYAHIYKTDLNASDEAIAATRARLSFTTDMAASVAEADLVIECVPEIPDVKIELYQELANHLPEQTLLATNSSTLLPSQFAAFTGRPEKYCALHFANLIWTLNLAEIMAHPRTSDETLSAVTRFAIEIGMVPVPVQKEKNGYVMNAMLATLVNAAQTLITNGISTPEYVDRTHMILHRGCAMGPCGLFDVVGMNTAYNILSYWGEVNDDEQMKKNAAYIKEHFLDKGLLGVQTGQGYYTYPNPAYQASDFLDIPDVSQSEKLSMLARPK